jgi:transcriptional regulator with XRE-family HTH domain
MIMELIGKKIKEKRKERKLTQAQLGEKIGACYVSVCNLEKGRNVSTHLLRDACNELGLELIITDK